MATLIEVRVPDIGDLKDAAVIEWLIKPGDLIQKNQPVIMLESEKATLDVPTPVQGRVAALMVATGARVCQGSVIFTLEPDQTGESEESIITHSAHAISVPAAEFPSVSVEPMQPNKVSPIDIARSSGIRRPATNEVDPERIYASPSIRRLARQIGADLTNIAGTGRRGRIVIDDVYRVVRDELQTPKLPAAQVSERPSPKIDFAKFGDIERQPLSRIRRVSGTSLARNWATIPHVTNFDEADITELESFRVKLNKESSGIPKITLLSFLVKAVSCTLHHAPAFNASLDGDELIVKKYVNVGVAVDTPDGLLVPVIHGSDKLGIFDIARELSANATAAQTGKLKSSDFAGGCFTVSSLGGVGGTGFTPIINAPEIAILGVAKAAIKPHYDGSQFLPRLMLPLALSWDHRATDGVAAAKFLGHLVTLLQDFRRVSL